MNNTVNIAEQEAGGNTMGKRVEGRVSPNYSQSRPIQTAAERMIERRCVSTSEGTPELDAYKVLRTRILHQTREKGMNTIMVTSPNSGEGTTLTCVNLALTFAREFKHTVLLVDCDFRKQAIHEVLGIPGQRGLADNLLDELPLAELIVWPGIEKLTVISGGRTIGESTELIGSPRMADLVAEMKSRYPDRYIFFDLPAVNDSADAAAFAPLVDSIVLVVEYGRTPESDVKKALRLLPREKVLGVVVNRRPAGV